MRRVKQGYRTIRRIATSLAFIALLLQAFWPMASAAGIHGQNETTLQICTAHGLQEVAVKALGAGQKQAPAQGQYLHDCQLCCLASAVNGLVPDALTFTLVFTSDMPATPLAPLPLRGFSGALFPPRGPPAVA